MTARATGQALSALRSVAPSDVAAWRALSESAPEVMATLLQSVGVALAQVNVSGLERSDVAEHAALIVARVFADNPRQSARDAARRAVRYAAVAVANASRDADLYGLAGDPMSDMVRTRLAAASVPATDVASAVRLSDYVATAEGTLPPADASVFRAIRQAWSRHDVATCERCADAPPSRRPSPLGILCHVTGLDPRTGRGRAMCDQSRRVLQSVAPVIRECIRTYGITSAGKRSATVGVWGQGTRDLSGLAADAVTRMHSREYLPDRPGMSSGRVYVAVPETVYRATPRAELARAVARAENRERRLLEQSVPATFRPVPVNGWRLSPEASDDISAARNMVALVSRLASETATSRAVGTRVAIRPVDVPRVLAGPVASAGSAAPDCSLVTVRDASGAVTVRALTDREADALRPGEYDVRPDADGLPVETPVKWQRWQGEEYGETTSPARESDRDSRTGQVKSFKPVVSPRKRPRGTTGPTVPAGPGRDL